MDIIQQYIPNALTLLGEGESLNSVRVGLRGLLNLENNVYGVMDHYMNINLHITTKDSNIYSKENPLLEFGMNLSKLVGPVIAVSTKGIQMDDIARVHHYHQEMLSKKQKKGFDMIDYNVKLNDIKRAYNNIPKELLSQHIRMYQSEHIKYLNELMGQGSWEWIDTYNKMVAFVEKYQLLEEALGFLDKGLLSINYKQTAPTHEFVDLYISMLYDPETGENINYFDKIFEDFKLRD